MEVAVEVPNVIPQVSSKGGPEGQEGQNQTNQNGGSQMQNAR